MGGETKDMGTAELRQLVGHLTGRVETLEEMNAFLTRVASRPIDLYEVVQNFANFDASGIPEGEIAEHVRERARRALNAVDDENRHYLPFVAWFALYMEFELYDNDETKGKFGWRTVRALDLLPKFNEEIFELVRCVCEGSGNVLKEAVDVANVAAMIADVAAREATGKAEERQ